MGGTVLGLGNAEPLQLLELRFSKLLFAGFPLGGSVVLHAGALRKAVVPGVPSCSLWLQSP